MFRQISLNAKTTSHSWALSPIAPLTAVHCIGNDDLDGFLAA